MIPYLIAAVGGFLIGDSMSGKKFSDGGVMWRVEPSTIEEDMEETRNLVGEERWNSLSIEEKKDLTNFLKSQGEVGIIGQEEDIETISGLQYYEKGGNVKYVKDEDKYKHSWGRISGSVGEFDIKDSNKWWYGTLYPLDDFDKDYWKNVALKPSERLFRYETYTTKTSGIRPVVKININKGIIYFLKDLDSDDDKNLDFETKGIKLKLLQLNENLK